MQNQNQHPVHTYAVVLAGGKGRRVDGRDKGLITLKGKTLVEHVCDSVGTQVDTCVINANRNLTEYAQFGYPVVSDASSHFDGPLAGVSAAMHFLESNFSQDWQSAKLFSVPCDVINLPANIVSKLRIELKTTATEVCVLKDAHRLQPLVALYSTKALNKLRKLDKLCGIKMQTWIKSLNYSVLDLSHQNFTLSNLNTLEDLRHAEQRSETNRSKLPYI